MLPSGEVVSPERPVSLVLSPIDVTKAPDSLCSVVLCGRTLSQANKVSP